MEVKIKMSLLYKAEGFFTHKKMKMVQNPEVKYVRINITTNGFEFIGAYATFATIDKNSADFHLDLPWTNIKNINKTKARAMHTITIETVDNFYTILPLDPDHFSSFNPMSHSKRNAIELLDVINKAINQIKELKNSKEFEESNLIICPECGVEVPNGSKFCGNCGGKVL
jgi:hypothetical protein